MAKSPRLSKFAVENGTVISVSGKKTATAAIVVAVIAILALAMLAGSLATCLAGMGIFKDSKNTSPAVLYALAGLALLIGLGLLAWVGVLGYSWGSAFFQKQRFIIAKNAIQLVVGNKVQIHLPYDNIGKL